MLQKYISDYRSTRLTSLIKEILNTRINKENKITGGIICRFITHKKAKTNLIFLSNYEKGIQPTVTII